MKLSGLLKFIKRSRLKSFQGFSLVELMVVVAIIGILAAVAIPNYQRFQRKSQQTEAKGLLSGIYTAERTFATEHGFATPNIDQAGFSPEGRIQYRAGFSSNNLAGGSINPNTAIRPAGYLGPLPADIDDLDTIILCKSGGTGTGSCSLALGITASSTPWSGFSSGSCGPSNPAHTGCSATNPTDCSNNKKSGCKNASNKKVAGAWSSGALVNNSNRFNPNFTIGALGDIGGVAIDEWTMNQAKQLTNIKDGSQ